MSAALRVAFVALAILAVAGWGDRPKKNSSDVWISHDFWRCSQGWITMPVAVTVNGESFKFEPSCSFSFSDSFATRKKKKTQCKIYSGMFSGFLPEKRINVECDDGGSASVSFNCKS